MHIGDEGAVKNDILLLMLTSEITLIPSAEIQAIATLTTFS